MARFAKSEGEKQGQSYTNFFLTKKKNPNTVGSLKGKKKWSEGIRILT